MTNTAPQDIEWIVAIEIDSPAANQPLVFDDLTTAQGVTLEITEEELSDYYGAKRPAGFYDYAADIWSDQWAFEEYDPQEHDITAISACGHNFTNQGG